MNAAQAGEELKRLAEAYADAALRAGVPAMTEALLYLHGRIPEYADPIVGSRYRRSLTLGRRWTEQVELLDDAVVGQIGTNVAYAPWVVGPDHPGADFGGTTKYQAKVHKGRWWQFESVMEANVDGAWAEFEAAYWPALAKELGGVR